MNTALERKKPGFKRILVPIDFSDDSFNALQMAQDTFAHSGATLILVNAVDLEWRARQ